MNIYGFDKTTGKRIRLYRIKCKQMKLELVKNDNNRIQHLKTFQDLVEENKDILEKIEEESLRLIQFSIDKYEDYKKYILTSMGKDSIVITHLVRKIEPQIPAKFNNTTLDTYHTYKLAKKLENIEIMNPAISFYEWREEQNFVPTQFGRGCCRVFKEEATADHISDNKYTMFFYGMRNSESTNRKNYDFEWENTNWTTDKWIGILPIKNWTDMNIWLYIFREKLIINPMYTFGYGRVGCSVPCPFRTDYENYLDKHFLPKGFNKWQKVLEKDFVENFKWPILNCTLQEYLNGAWKGGRFREESTQEIIKEFAKAKNLDLNIAAKYFNKECECGKKIKKDAIGLSMKYFGRSIEKFFCMDCLSKQLGRTKKQLKQDIKDFKMQGCDLF